jgi:nitroimidazol reductase NimA-like FMN-containing flavoprotein (pyridoxamine 5'-phosphate oxidase superfamily)
MLEQMKTLIKERDMCVLATCSQGRPHCSLMAYVAEEDGETVYMATRRDTTKYSYLRENPLVSLLIDTRREQGAAPRREIHALTVDGRFEAVEDADERQRLLERIAVRHPHLEKLALHPDADVLRIRVESFLLLQGPMEAHHETIRR